MDQPAEAQNNLEQYEEVLKKVSPDLYLIYEAQKLTNVQWDIIREIIGSIHDVAWNGGTGAVKVVISRGVVNYIQGEKNRTMGLSALIEINE